MNELQAFPEIMDRRHIIILITHVFWHTNRLKGDGMNMYKIQSTRI